MDDLVITDVCQTATVLSIEAARKSGGISVTSNIPDAGEHEMAQAP